MFYLLGDLLENYFGPARLLTSHLNLIIIGLTAGFVSVIYLLPRLFRLLPTDRGREYAVQAEDSVSIYDVQYTLDPGGDSPYNGQAVTVVGTVSGVFLEGYALADSCGPWHSVFVRSRRDGPDIGDEVAVTGTVRENFGMTEIYEVTDYDFISPDNTVLSWSVEAQDIQQEISAAMTVINLD